MTLAICCAVSYAVSLPVVTVIAVVTAACCCWSCPACSLLPRVAPLSIATAALVELKADFSARGPCRATWQSTVSPCCPLLRRHCQQLSTVPQHHRGKMGCISAPVKQALFLFLPVILIKEEHRLPREAGRLLPYPLGVLQICLYVEIWGILCQLAQYLAVCTDPHGQ